MTCKLCGGTCVWNAELTFTICLKCGAKNSNIMQALVYSEDDDSDEDEG